MTTATVPASSYPSVFDADLPTLNYLHLQHSEDAHRVIAAARAQAPIGLGAFGPEVLNYDLVRAVLGDPRFAAAHRSAAEAQGAVSGPLWERITTLILSIDGERHQRPTCVVHTPWASDQPQCQTSRNFPERSTDHDLRGCLTKFGGLVCLIFEADLRAMSRSLDWRCT